MTFRPYPGFTVFAVIMIAILCGLGVWQLQRLQWKLALIARVNGHLAAAPISLDELARAADLSIRDVRGAVLELEIAGRIERHGGGLVSLIMS